MLPLLTVSLILCLVGISGKGWTNNATKNSELVCLHKFFLRQYYLCYHVCFVNNERLKCEIKVPLRYYSVLYRHHTQKLYQKLQYPEFFPTQMQVLFLIFNKYIIHKLADADPACNLDSCSVTWNEIKIYRIMWLRQKAEHYLCKSSQSHHIRTPCQIILRYCLIYFLDTVSNDYFSQLLPIPKCFP